MLLNLDIDGIKMLYPSSTSNPQYFRMPTTKTELENRKSEMDFRIELDERILAKIASDGETIEYYELDNNQKVRMKFCTSEGVHPTGGCSTKQSVYLDRGYIFTPKDWKNIEATIFWKAVSYGPSDFRMITKTRTGNHHSNTDCMQGNALNFSVYAKGKKTRISWEEYHVHYHHLDDKMHNIVNTDNNWFGAKQCVFNVGSDNVKIEGYLCPSLSAEDRAKNWFKVNDVLDFPGSGWGDSGLDNDLPNKSYPLLWGGPYHMFRWDGATRILFMYASVREIDPQGQFGGTPTPPSDGGNNTPPPPNITQFLSRWNIRTALVTNNYCNCEGGGSPAPPGGGGGGGGGSGVLETKFDYLNSKIDGYIKLASENGSTTFKLQTGLTIVNTSTPWYNKKIRRIMFDLYEKNKPRGGTGDAVHVKIRKALDDNDTISFTPSVDEEDIHDDGGRYVVENTTNNYAMQVGDTIFFEYDGGDDNNYVKVPYNTTTANFTSRLKHRNNTQSAGTYSTQEAKHIMKIEVLKE